MKTKIVLKHHRRLMFWIKWSMTSSLAFSMLAISFGQITVSTNESPYTLGKGVFEFAGIYNKTGVFSEGAVDYLKQPGIKVGTGITDHLDFKFAYFRDFNENIKDGFNVFQFIPKVGGPDGRLAFFIPVGIFHSPNKSGYEDGKAELLFFFSPKLNGAVIKKENWDICLAGYMEILKEKEYKAEVTGGINIGCGAWNNAKNVSLRAEFGMDLRMMIHNVFLWNVGMTFSYHLKPKSRKGQQISQSYNRYTSSLSKLIARHEGKIVVVNGHEQLS